MEENMTTQVETEKKPTYEQLENAVRQLHQRAMTAEARINAMDIAEMKLNIMFKVLEFKNSFSVNFVNKCAEAIEMLLTDPNAEVTTEESKENKTQE